MKKYYTYTVKKIITVQQLVTIEYLQIDSQFSFPEESHNFYELILVEKGSIFCKKQEGTFLLNKNDLYLIAPGQKHSYFPCQDTTETSSIFVLCFKSRSNIISTINGIKKVKTDIKELFTQILEEAKASFVFPFDEKLTLNEHPYIGSQQLIENYIEEILIKLVQEEIYKTQDIQIIANNSSFKKFIVKDIIHFLNENVYGRITLSEVSRHMLYSKTYLNEIFKEVKKVTIMQYYQDLKIKEAKILLNKHEVIADIAEKLCFESPQYFSKTFKKKVGMTPIEYKKATFNKPLQ